MSDLISRSDAIGAVKEERFPIDSDYAEGFMAALDKVEWILKEWLPSAQPDSKELSGTHKALDTVSRQAVIEAINKIFPADPMRDDYTQGITCGAALANIYVAQLPSAQPETHEKRTEMHACDSISRQAAIDICNNAIDLWHGQLGEGIVIAVKKKIEELPSAQPEMIKEIRKWINSGNRGNADYFIVEKIEEIINKYE